MNIEEIKAANEWLKDKLVNIKGKKYALVADRVTAFRMVCPSGSIITEIVDSEEGVVTMKATVCDEASKILGTGMAQEKEANGFVNSTSYIENCETSAVGRALGFVGIGIDESMASAEEVATAMRTQKKKQEEPESAPAFKAKTIREDIIKYCRGKKIKLSEIEEEFHLNGTTEDQKKDIFEKIKDKYGE